MVARSTTSRARRLALALAPAAALLLVAGPAQASGAGPGSAAHHPARGYVQTNLVSDQPGHAQITDPNLVNPWGLAAGPSTPVWVADNGTNVATIYAGGKDGGPVQAVPLVVSIPFGEPTGQVFNDTSGFVLPDGMPALFIFSSEAGRITAWNQQVSPITGAVKVAGNGTAVYKGLALLHRGAHPWLLATDFHNGRIDVFGTKFHRVGLPSWAFTDPSLPKGYAPFGITVVGGRVIVSYAKQDAVRHDDEKGLGHGFVDAYSSSGHLLARLVSRGVLDSPWGMTIAPRGFGVFSGDLLVGNFGNGFIHAFDPLTGQLRGTLRRPGGQPVHIDGLWGLLPGNGVAADRDDVIFSAGPDGESHGLLGVIRSASDE
jgi:uncharacterized protein (TIGR03118 family)